MQDMDLQSTWIQCTTQYSFINSLTTNDTHMCCGNYGDLTDPLYSTCMRPENTHKLMGFYMEILILGVIL